MKKWIIAALTLGITGCTSSKPVTNHYLLSETPEGSLLTLHQPVNVSANESRASLQFGKHVNQEHLDKWHPYCEIVTRVRSQSRQKISQGTYQITRVVKRTEPYTRLKSSSRHMLATADSNLSAIYADQDQALLYKTTFHLAQNRDSDLNRVVCGQVRTSPATRQLTLSDFREAVGSYLSINGH